MLISKSSSPTTDTKNIFDIKQANPKESLKLQISYYNRTTRVDYISPSITEAGKLTQIV